jgi:uncharacterized protein YjbI with pentapeptide repeats
MTRFVRTTSQVLVFTGVLAVSGMLIGAAAAANPAHVKQLMDTRSCAGCDLNEASLTGWYLPKANLTGANLAGANLYSANLSQATLTGADLSGTELRAANLLGATGAVLSSAKTDSRTTCPDGAKGPCK